MATESVREGGGTAPPDGGGAGFRIPVVRGQIERTYRDGDDLVVVVAGRETLRVKGFFAADGPSESVLILNAADQDGGYEVAEVSSEGRIIGTVEVSLGQLEEMFGRRSSDSGEGQDGDGTFSPERSMGLSPMAIGAPLGLLVAGAAIGGGGGGDDGGGGGSPAPSQQPQPEYQPSYQPAPAPAPAAQPQVEQPVPAPAVQPEPSVPQQSQERPQPQVESPPQPAVQPVETPQPAAQQFQPAETPQVQRATAPQPQTQQGPGEVEIDTSGAGRFEFDDDGDGTVDRIVERIDADGDGRFEEVTTETFADGVRDSRTYEQDIDDDGDFDQRDVYRYNGEGQLVRLERDEYADGILDSVVTHSYHANGTTESTEYDLQADGVFERKLSFSPAGLKVREEVDSDNDGAMDRVDTWTHHANGTVERHDADYENDGTVDKSVSYDSSGRKVRRVHDPDADGTKETTAWSYHGNGRVVARERTDSDSDGNFERIKANADADRSWDWIGHDSDDDGGLDRVEVVDGDAFSSGLGAALAAELAGVGTVDLSGGGGSAVLTLTDGDLTGLAGGASDYALAVDGGSGDTVRFGDSGIYDTGRSSGGRREYRGSDGEVLVKTGVSVEGVQDPLDALRENLAEATAEMFGLAGIQGVTSGNLAAVKKVIGAYGGMVASLTLEQLQNLAGIATDGITVPANGKLEGASLVQEGLALDINTDADASIEQRAVVSLDSAILAPTGVSRNVDFDGDGTRDDREVTDSNYDGTQDRTVERLDADSDGTYEKVVTKAYSDGTLDTSVIEWDENDNGTTERGTTLLYDEGTLDFKTESRDFNEDRTSGSTLSVEYVDGTRDFATAEWDYDADGTNERVLSVTYDDGTRESVIIEHDADDNGTSERIVMVQFVNGTVNSRTETRDFDEDGSSESVVRWTYVDGTRDANTVEWDHDEDGRYESAKTVEFTEGTPAIRTREWDLDGDGSNERFVVVTTSDGTRESRVAKWDHDADGTYEDVVTTVFVDGTISSRTNNMDSDGDGTREFVFEAEFSYGTENTRTHKWDNEGDGIWDRVVVRTDIDSDGTYETFEAETFNGGIRDRRVVKKDVDDDGSFEWRGVSVFNAEAELTRRRTDTNNDGTLDRTETYLYSPISGGGRKLQIRTDDGADGRIDTEEVKYDFDSDGSFDRSETSEFNARGLRVRYTSDSNADSTPERIETYRYERLAGGVSARVSHIDDDADGRADTEKTEYDFDSDGNIDRSETSEFNASGLRVRYTSDSNADGSPERIETYQYERLAGGGRVKVSRIDADADGTVDIVEMKYFTGSKARPDYIVYDGTGTSDRSDGTANRLEYRNRLDLEHRIDGVDAALVCVEEIDLSGRGGATTLTLTDSGLTRLAANDENYLLVIDGDDEDLVQFDSSSVQATGNKIGARDEYQHSSGRILIDSDIDVTGAVEPVKEVAMPAYPGALAWLLGNLASATVETFERAGVTGVHEGNLHIAKTLLGAYGSAIESLNLEQLQNLVKIATDGITRGAAKIRYMHEWVEGASFAREGSQNSPTTEFGEVQVPRIVDDGLSLPAEMAFEKPTFTREVLILDKNAINGNRSRIVVNLDPETLAPTGVSWSYYNYREYQYSDWGLGRRYFHSKNVDSDYDGTSDWKERHTLTQLLVYSSGSDQSEEDQDEAEITRWSLSSNYDFNGFEDGSGFFHYFEDRYGNVYGEEADFTIYRGRDAAIDDFGSIKASSHAVMDFRDGVNEVVYWPDHILNLPGKITEVNLAGDGGATTFVLYNADLMDMNLRGSTVKINGDADDTVRFVELGSRFRTFHIERGYRIGDYDEYKYFPDPRWSPNKFRTLLIDSDISVEYQDGSGKVQVISDFGLTNAAESAEDIDPLATLLANLATATVEMFRRAGVLGVSDGSLDDVKEVIGAFGARTASLTLDQVQNLADIVSAGIAVRANENLLAVVVDDDIMKLSLSVDADAEIEQTEKSVMLDLDSKTLVPTSLTRNLVLNDSEWNRRIEIDSNYSGFLDSVTWINTDPNNGNVNRITTDVFYYGVQQSQTVEVSSGSDSELVVQSQTIYNGDGDPELFEYFGGDSNGAAILTVRYSYPDSGTIEQIEFNYDGDGTVDSIETKYYVGSDDMWDYTVFDGTGVHDRSDGTADRLKYRDGSDLEHAIDGSDARLAGVDNIDLSEQGGATTLTFTDSGLTGMAAGGENFILVIDGDGDDIVRFGDGSVWTTGERLGNRGVYRHPAGKIAIDSDVEVVGAVERSGESDPLATLLANLDTATIGMFGLAGVAGVNGGTIDDVKKVIGAFESRIASMTLDQAQNLVDIAAAGIAVRDGENLLSVLVDGDSMTLNVSLNSVDYGRQREKIVSLNLDSSTLSPIDLTRTIEYEQAARDQRIETDSDYDGTLDGITTTYSYSNISKVYTFVLADGTRESGTAVVYDSNGEVDKLSRFTYHDNGKMESKEDYNNGDDVLSRRTLWDSSGRGIVIEGYRNGELAQRETYTYRENTRILETDSYDAEGRYLQADGTPETRVHVDLANNKRKLLEEFDTDYDGTMDKEIVWSYDNGRLSEQGRVDNNLDGTADQIVHVGRNDRGEDLYRLYDNEVDGTWDILEFNGRYVESYELDADLARFISGITSIEMTRFWYNPGTLTITDDTLTSLAGNEEDYSIVIMNEGRGLTLDLRSGGIERITGDGDVDAEGRLGYQGTDAKLYIDPDITVLV